MQLNNEVKINRIVHFPKGGLLHSFYNLYQVSLDRTEHRYGRRWIINLCITLIYF